jgi:hypothetical protein
MKGFRKIDGVLMGFCSSKRQGGLWHCVVLQVITDVSRDQDYYNLSRETETSAETSLKAQNATRCHKPEDHNFCHHRHKNLGFISSLINTGCMIITYKLKFLEICDRTINRLQLLKMTFLQVGIFDNPSSSWSQTSNETSHTLHCVGFI